MSLSDQSVDEPVGQARKTAGGAEHLRRVLALKVPQRQKRLGIAGLVVVVLLMLIAIFAPVISPYDPTERVGIPFSPPSSEHLLGTNDVGKDILSELIFGSRVSLIVGLTTAVSAVVIGTIIGLVAGFYRGKTDGALMRFADLILVLPFLPLMIIMAAFFGSSVANLVVIMAVLSWPWAARVIRSRALTLHSRGFVESARALGAGNRRLMFKYFTPLLTPLALSQFILIVPYAILVETTLSFLGLGDPTVPTWGSMLFWANSRGAFLSDAWLWWIVPTGLAISITVLAFTYTGYLLESVLDARSKRH